MCHDESNPLEPNIIDERLQNNEVRYLKDCDPMNGFVVEHPDDKVWKHRLSWFLPLCLLEHDPVQDEERDSFADLHSDQYNNLSYRELSQLNACFVIVAFISTFGYIL